MIIWLNGPFGAGKTTTAKLLVPLLPNARIFDSEVVGDMLRHVLDLVQVDDFQDWAPWRGLVVATAAQVLDYVGGTLVIPQSVLVKGYWDEIADGFASVGIPVSHIALHVDPEELTRRIHTDTTNTSSKPWRLGRIHAYQSALSWLRREASVIDATRLAPTDVARLISRTNAAIRR